METIRTKLIPHGNSGKRESWFKHVTAVDQSKRDGYAFQGNFIPTRQEVELPVGAVVIEKVPKGSVKNGWFAGWVYVVTDTPAPHGPDTGSAKAVPYLKQLDTEKEYDWRADFLSFRDRVAELVVAAKEATAEDDSEPEPEPEQAQEGEGCPPAFLRLASDEQLLAECRKRGLLDQ